MKITAESDSKDKYFDFVHVTFWYDGKGAWVFDFEGVRNGEKTRLFGGNPDRITVNCSDLLNQSEPSELEIRWIVQKRFYKPKKFERNYTWDEIHADNG